MESSVDKSIDKYQNRSNPDDGRGFFSFCDTGEKTKVGYE